MNKKARAVRDKLTGDCLVITATGKRVNYGHEAGAHGG